MDTESKFETFVLGTLFFIAIFCAGLMVGWIAMLMLFEIFNITSGSFYDMIAENFLPAQSILGVGIFVLHLVILFHWSGLERIVLRSSNW